MNETIYTVATPNQTVETTDAGWAEVASRAGHRVTARTEVRA